ncbi:hypothetical protein ACHQM5_030543 [Ranunculus cassubicifolius]
MATKLVTGTSLAKHLASCNENTRGKALRLLKTWLPSNASSISSDEMKKIWKGLFYCVWHADKQQFQIELINRLSSYLVSLDLQLSLQYFHGFLLMIRREWSGIDYLRLDKFYLLIRRFLFHLFLMLKNNGWEIELVKNVMCVLEEKTLLSIDRYPAQGVNYHLAEIFMTELKGFLPLKRDVIEELVKPFVSVLGKSLDKVLLNKIKNSLFGCLLDNGRKLLERKRAGNVGEEGNADEVDLFGTIALTLGLSKRFFDLGSSSDCVQGNRKVLFSLHEEFSKLEKDFASLGVEISVPKVNNVSDDDEVPQLVHISLLGNGTAEQAAEKLSKKKKKKKDKKSSSEIGSGTKKSEEKQPSSEIGSGTKNSEEKQPSSGSGLKKSKKKKRDLSANSDNGDSSTNVGGLVNFNETVISNLQMQFEKVAAEVGMDIDGTVSFDSPEKPVILSVPKKRKRAKSIDGQVSLDDGGSAIGKSGEKSSKKVRFSMKNNVVWKPHSPLPPQSLRLPPSATPRGSALKKGIPAGPVIETPTSKKVKRRTSPLKKAARKGMKSVSPSVRRLKKLRAQSA